MGVERAGRQVSGRRDFAPHFRCIHVVLLERSDSEFIRALEGNQ